MADKPTAGRPTLYSQELADSICERLLSDPPESLRSICRDESMPGRTTVLRWLADNEAFRGQYAQARELQADCYRDDGDEISRNIKSPEDAQVARVQLDWIKWNAGRMAPKKYGDKLQQEVTGADGKPFEAAVTINFVRSGAE